MSARMVMRASFLANDKLALATLLAAIKTGKRQDEIPPGLLQTIHEKSNDLALMLARDPDAYQWLALFRQVTKELKRTCQERESNENDRDILVTNGIHSLEAADTKPFFSLESVSMPLVRLEALKAWFSRKGTFGQNDLEPVDSQLCPLGPSKWDSRLRTLSVTQDQFAKDDIVGDGIDETDRCVSPDLLEKVLDSWSCLPYSAALVERCDR